MSEGKQPDRKKRTYIRKFDLIGELLENYGDMTGGNIVREIFSYLDFSTLQRGLLVANSWKDFLANDKKIWLDLLEKQVPNLIHFTNKLAENEEENSTYWKEVWSSIEKEDNIGPKELIDSFKKVQHIYEIVKIHANRERKRLENEAENFPPHLRYDYHWDYLPYQDDFVGEKVKEEIQREIKKKENPFMVSLQGEMKNLEVALFYTEVPKSWNRPRKDKILREIRNYLLNELTMLQK